MDHDAIVEALMDKCTELSKDGADIADLTNALITTSDVMWSSFTKLKRDQAEGTSGGIVH